MGGGGQKSSGTSQQTTTVQLPAWVEKASQENYERAKAVANRPFQQYTGQTVADLSPEFAAARGMLGQLDDYAGNYGAASNALAGMLGYNPAEINPGYYNASQIAGQDINPYLNPYIENVESRAISNAQRAGEQAQNKLATDAAAARAFGGSRQGVQQAVQAAETTRGIGDLSATLRKQGYDSAMGYLEKDIAAQNAERAANAAAYQKAQESSRQNEISALTAKTGAARTASDVANAAQQAKTNEIATNLGVGKIAEEHDQANLDRSREMWENEWNYPLESLNILLSSLGMSPYGRTETGTKTESTKSGGGSLLAGILGSLIPAGAQMFAASDRSLKTDIEKLGDVEGLPIYAYRYKKDPKSYPKVVGPMAQDVEKLAPERVAKVGGKRVIRLGAL